MTGVLTAVAELDPAVRYSSEDVCSLALARRMAALLDQDPMVLQTGMALPRGWHVLLFNPPTRQSQLRPDGAAELGIPIPDLGLPRLMMGGRKIDFHGDIPIGAALQRVSRCESIDRKAGRSGNFAIVRIVHEISVHSDPAPVLTETSSYVLREAEQFSDRPRATQLPGPSTESEEPLTSTTITPDEAMLFRYSAITDNPHRIHYDADYAKRIEGYPTLLVNGSLPMMFLLGLFRDHLGREPGQVESRNLAPMYCGQPLLLALTPDGAEFKLSATGSDGTIMLEGRAS